MISAVAIISKAFQLSAFRFAQRHNSRRQLLCRPTRRNTVQHAFGANVFVNSRPVYALAVTNDLKVVPLLPLTSAMTARVER
jgi:hypothetical protein